MCAFDVTDEFSRPTEGNGPAKSVTYGKIWIFVIKMNVFWVI